MDRPTVTREDRPAQPLADILVIAMRAGEVIQRHEMSAGGELRIGSRAGVGLVVDDPMVSRDHARLSHVAGEIEIEDLGSKNGTWLAGSRIERACVRPPATLRIGDCTIQIIRLGSEPDVARFGGLFAASRAMRDVFALAQRLADHDAPVLVLGETGTGKDLVSRALHVQSRRANEPFVVVDLAALSTGVVESELFGHVRGAFTGAVADRPGAFEAAGAGTVFLDEIGEMPLALQPRLLRVLEASEAKRVGANRYYPSRARVIAATNRDLDAEVAAGTFREDLYHRLAVVVIRLPPLRERREDISILVDAFVADRTRLPIETRQALIAHDWPGNVRQLRHVLERAMLLADGEITPELLGLGGDAPPRRTELAPFKQSKQRLVDAWEREYVADLVARCGNLSDAARKAGIARAHLHRLLRKHDLG